MKKTLFTMVAILFATVFVSAQADYKMWETIYIVPKKGSEEDLKKGLAEHNKEFHKEDPYKAYVWEVISGKHEGQWLWVMGPLTFTDLDNAPAGEDKHDKDWNEKIDPYCEKIHEVKYWKLNEKVSYSPEDNPGDKVLWATIDIRPFEMYRFNAMLEKVAEVYKEKKYDHGFSVYTSAFDSGDGEDVVLEWQFGKWAWFDREEKFRKDYEEVHGEGTWWQFMEEYQDVVESSTDELAVLLKDLSGGE
jgi:hypothetical protein